MSYDPTLLAHTTTPWGGRRGAPLTADQQRPGRRAVTEDGRHGLILSEPSHGIFFGKVPLDEGSTSILLDSGASQGFPTPRLFEEAAPPDPARIEPDLPYLNESTFHRSTEPALLIKPGPGAPRDRTVVLRMTAGQLYRAHERVLEKLRTSYLSPDDRALLLDRARATLRPLLDWAQRHPDHPDRAEMSDRVLHLLRYEIYGTDGDAFAEQDMALLRALPPDWTRSWRVGDRVAVLDERDADFKSGWTIDHVDRERATLHRGSRRTTAMLWRLRLEQSGPRPRIALGEPVSFQDVLADSLAVPAEARSLGSVYIHKLERALQPTMHKIVQAWLAEQGVAAKVTRHRSSLSIRPRAGAFTADELRRLEEMLPAKGHSPWAPEGEWRSVELALAAPAVYKRDLWVGAEHAERLAVMFGEVLRAAGFRTSRVGDERRAETAGSCQTLNFDLPGHGRIRVDCGDPHDPAAWHSLFIKDSRYAWGAGQWLRNKVPPLAVLEAVRQRGVRVFG